MNKAFEKILEKLEEVENRLLNESGDIGCTLGITNMSEYSKEIVQEVEKQYNNGWIPCSDRLPEEKDGVVLICEQNGIVETGRYSEFSNQWYKGDMCGIGGSKVIAYQPLPEPYKESE